jgi:hypothetical protein
MIPTRLRDPTGSSPPPLSFIDKAVIGSTFAALSNLGDILAV